MVTIMRWSYPQEEHDEDNDVVIIPGNDPDAGMLASEAEIHGIDRVHTQFEFHSHLTRYQRTYTIIEQFQLLVAVCRNLE